MSGCGMSECNTCGCNREWEDVSCAQAVRNAAEQERANIVARLQRLRETLAASGNGEAALMVALAMADIEHGANLKGGET